MSGPSATAVCWLTSQWGIGADVLIAYSMAPHESFERERERLGENTNFGELVAWDGIGDAAFGYTERLPVRVAYHTPAGHTKGWARVGDHTVWVRVNRSMVPLEEVRPLLEKVVERVSPAMHEHPIVLPAECPAPDHPVLARVFGEVEYARGDAGWECTYISSRGWVMRAGGVTLSPEALQQENESSDRSLAQGTLRQLSAPAGTSRLRGTDARDWADYLTIDATRQMLQLNFRDAGSGSRPVGVSEADFDELMDVLIQAWRDAVG
ncbi:hypothetical protein [Nocardioides limicola]|uniref:hypothetical protein n=1 Tax=Nocardioides limicola TaxID=2803368 RepID=UPI00193B0B92|nr:hypothetical protein [Nocardioides sp. DJM-14]